MNHEPHGAAAALKPVARNPVTDDAWRHVLQAACAPYRTAGRFAWHFAQGKLGRDPIFRTMLEQGWVRPGERVLDIGCGQGLLAGLLGASAAARRAGRWPQAWGPAPHGNAYHGIELMPRDVARARGAMADLVANANFVCEDMRDAKLPLSDVAVILDVLHYVSHAEQDAVLARVHAALGPAGRLLLRVGDAAQHRGFAVSQWVDRIVTFVRGHRVPPTFGRTLAQWLETLARAGFTATPVPMSQGTPFANVLLLAQPAASAQPAREAAATLAL